MNHAQWLYEATILRQKEERDLDRVREVFKAGANAFREGLVHLLGLNIGAGNPEILENGEKGSSPFVPLIAFCGRPEVVDEMLKKHAEHQATNGEGGGPSANNDALGVLNDSLMDLDIGDLEPLFTGINSEDPSERWASEEHQSLLKSLGIDVKKDVFDEDEIK